MSCHAPRCVHGLGRDSPSGGILVIASPRQLPPADDSRTWGAFSSKEGHLARGGTVQGNDGAEMKGYNRQLELSLSMLASFLPYKKAGLFYMYCTYLSTYVVCIDPRVEIVIFD